MQFLKLEMNKVPSKRIRVGARNNPNEKPIGRYTEKLFITCDWEYGTGNRSQVKISLFHRKFSMTSLKLKLSSFYFSLTSPYGYPYNIWGF
jgi:hypothetical protein